MYSVLIMNQNTMDSFVQYHPLFFEGLTNHSLGVCRWNEFGRTLDTAVPDIRNLTDDKSEWRAVIVRLINSDSTFYETDQRNPYDYLVNSEYSEQLEESEIPLIRLTQMLGGVPPLEIQFKPEVVSEENKAPHTVYVPVYDEEKEAAHKRLASKYRFDGRMPSSIVLVTMRIKPEENAVGMAWENYRESKSSEFWRRNHYPSICRFLSFDIYRQGPVQLEADLFNFWCSIMLISTNEIDSDVVQAYRLYSMKTDLDTEEMSLSFQAFADRMRDIKASTKKSITREQEKRFSEDPELPGYKIKVPVSVSFPKQEDYSVKSSSFHLFSNGANIDLDNWDKQKKNAEESLIRSVKVVERALDQTAVRTRPFNTYDEYEVSILTPYQDEDMNREVNQLLVDVVTQQGELPDVDIVNNERLREESAKIQKYLRGRTMRRSAVIALAVVFVCLFLSLIPGFIEHHKTGASGVSYGLVLLLIEFGIVSLVATIVLLFQKMKINHLIKQYNKQVGLAFARLNSCADDYSSYMGSIASHSRGKTYMFHSDHKKYISGMEEDTKYKHLKAVDVLVSKLKLISKAYGLNVYFDSRRMQRELMIDYDVDPYENKLYTFESGNVYQAELNSSGNYMFSPFKFVVGIEIKREELYDQ